MSREYDFSSFTFSVHIFAGSSQNFYRKYKKTTLRPHTTIDTEKKENASIENLPIQKEQMNIKKTCSHCGLQCKLRRHKCAALNEYCTKCGEKGHFARVCHFLGETNSQNETPVNKSGAKSPQTLRKFQNERQRGNAKTVINDENNMTEFNTNNSDNDTTSKNIKSDEKCNNGEVKNSRSKNMTKTETITKNKQTMNKEELPIQMKVDANTLYAQGSYNLALPKYTELIRQCPDAEIYGNRAGCYMMIGQYDNALYDAKKAIELDKTYIQAHVRAIKSAFIIGNLIEAEMVLNQLKKIDPQHSIFNSDRICVSRVRDYLKGADESYMKEDYNEALQNINKALELCTHCISYKVKKGEYLCLLERYKDSQVVINDVLKYEPSNIDAKYILGLCIYQSDATKAVSYFKDILRLIPDSSKVIIIYKKAKMLAEMKEKGNDAFHKKKYKTAYEFYTKALEIDPNNKGMKKILYYNQAQTSYKLGNIEQSIIECTKALAIDPQYVKALMRRGQCYIDQKEYEEAVADLAKACEIDAGNDCQNLLKKAKKLLNDAQSDYYGILGVNRNASQDEIKKAYKMKALLHHPDRHANSSAMEKMKHEKIFKQITRAYRLLITRESHQSRGESKEASDSDEEFEARFSKWYNHYRSFFESQRQKA